MKAVVYRHTGAAADVLEVIDIPTPEPGPSEVRVRVRCSGVNPTDWKSRSGATATARPVEDFQIPHHDGAGTIDAVGPGVDQRRLGERVWLRSAAHGHKWGTAAEFSVVPEQLAVPLPDGVSFELGASLGVPALTAHRCLFADGAITGRTVLVAGGAGAIGHFAIELGKHAGARVVTTVSSEEKARLARDAGADLVVNYREPDALARIKAFTDTVARVVEVNLTANLQLDLALARFDTVIMTYAADGPNPELPVRACMGANVVLRFMLLYTLAPAAIDAAVAGVSAALDAGALTELPVHRFALEQCAAAQDAVQQGAVGKVLLDLS